MEHLLAFVRASGRDLGPFEHAARSLDPVLHPLLFGFQPARERLDREALITVAGPTAEILGWLADSRKADLREAAIGLMGALGWESFLPRLEQALVAPNAWERAAAVKALAKVGTARTRSLLVRALDDPDPAIRLAARRATDASATKEENHE